VTSTFVEMPPTSSAPSPVATFGIIGAVSDPDGVPIGSTTAGIVDVDIGLVTTVFAPGVILAIDA
jgi:hypothetical protein